MRYSSVPERRRRSLSTEAELKEGTEISYWARLKCGRQAYLSSPHVDRCCTYDARPTTSPFESSLLVDFSSSSIHSRKSCLSPPRSVIPIGSAPVQSQPSRPALAERNVYETAESLFLGGLGSRCSTDHRSPPAVPIALVVTYLLGEARGSSNARVLTTGFWRRPGRRLSAAHDLRLVFDLEDEKSHAYVATPSIDGSTSGRSRGRPPRQAGLQLPPCPCRGASVRGDIPSRSTHLLCTVLSATRRRSLAGASRILWRNVSYYTS